MKLFFQHSNIYAIITGSDNADKDYEEGAYTDAALLDNPIEESDDTGTNSALAAAFRQ